MWQEIHQGKCETHVLRFTSIRYDRKLCLIYGCLSSASMVIRSWFIYELQKSTTIAFSRNSLYTFYSRNPTCGIPPCLRISNRKYPPCPEDSIIVNPPPSPSGIVKAVRGIGIDIFWNRPMSTNHNITNENGHGRGCLGPRPSLLGMVMGTSSEGGWGGVVVDSRYTGCLSDHPIATSWPLQCQRYFPRFISLWLDFVMTTSSSNICKNNDNQGLYSIMWLKIRLKNEY